MLSIQPGSKTNLFPMRWNTNKGHNQQKDDDKSVKHVMMNTTVDRKAYQAMIFDPFRNENHPTDGVEMDLFARMNDQFVNVQLFFDIHTSSDVTLRFHLT